MPTPPRAPSAATVAMLVSVVALFLSPLVFVVLLAILPRRGDGFGTIGAAFFGTVVVAVLAVVGLIGSAAAMWGESRSKRTAEDVRYEGGDERTDS